MSSLVRLLRVVALVLLTAPMPVLAHENGLLTPSDIWTHWNADPLIAATIGLVALLYSRGVMRLWQRAGKGHGVRVGQVWAFAGGVVALLVALVSPLDALSGSLFSAHMVQHLLLIVVAAPLLVLGAPSVPLLWGMPPAWRRPLGGVLRWQALRGLWRVLTIPLGIVVLHAAAIWVWHLPGPYQSALSDEGLHALEHASFFVTALLFWWVVLHPRGRHGYGLSVLMLFGTALQGGALGALLSFARSSWYPAHVPMTAPWGLTPLEDQQVAGMVMWVPGGVVYVVAAAVLFATWLQADEARQRRGERGVVVAERAQPQARDA